jgi:hypothetical protein
MVFLKYSQLLFFILLGLTSGAMYGNMLDSAEKKGMIEVLVQLPVRSLSDVNI